MPEKLVGRWWNGMMGRWVRRDVWLYSDGESWRVEARQGDGDSKVWQRTYDLEHEARAQVNLMLKRSGDEWKDIIHLY